MPPGRASIGHRHGREHVRGPELPRPGGVFYEPVRGEPRLAFGVNRGVADNVVQAPRFDNRACARSGRGSLLPVALTASMPS